jgi:hypothetical protein
MSHPIPNTALDDRLAFVGTSGSGKTYGAGSAVERLLVSKARVVIIDPLGAWWGLGITSDGKNPSVFRDKERLVIFGGEHGDMELLPNSGALMGETIAGMAESCIVDLEKMGSDAEQRRFVLAMLMSLFKNKPRDVLLHVICDEADMFAPQIILDKDGGEAPKLLGMMQKLVKRGRKPGFIPWLITQNPAGIAKSVLGQVDGMVSFSLTSSQDRDAIGNWVKGQANEEQWDEIWSTMPTLETGRALVWLPRRKVFKLDTFPKKVTFDSSRAPKRGERVKAKKLKPINLDKLKVQISAYVEQVKASDPKELRAAVAKLTAEKTALEKRAADAASKPADPKETKKADKAAIAAAEERGFEQAKKKLDRNMERELHKRLKSVLSSLRGYTAKFVEQLDGELEAVRFREAKAEEIAFTPSPAPPVQQKAPPAQRQASRVTAEGGAGDIEITKTQQAILDAIAWTKLLGANGASKMMVAFLADSSPKSSTFEKYISLLKSGGFIVSPKPHFYDLTDKGAAQAAQMDTPPTHEAMMDAIARKLTDGQLAIVRGAVAVFPNSIGKEDLAMAAGMSATSSTFEKYVSQMRSLGLLESPAAKTYQAADCIFPGVATAA